MSTNKTENCHLHAWEPGDDFLLSEINENFERLDGLMVTGRYMGDGEATREMVLGFVPRAVYLCLNTGSTTFSGQISTTYGGLALIEAPLISGESKTAVELTQTGFLLHLTSYGRVNQSNCKYHYWVLR